MFYTHSLTHTTATPLLLLYLFSSFFAFPSSITDFQNPPPLGRPEKKNSYIHGGAFRDPLITSLSLLPSLSSIFARPGSAGGKKISIAVASLNYRLSAYYPAHFSNPSRSEGDEDRNVIWPTHLDDVLKAIHFLFSSTSSSSSLTFSSSSTTTAGKKDDGEEEKEEKGGIILCGHSVGGTLAVHAAAALLIKAAAAAGSGEGNDNINNNIPPVRAVISLAGIFNFRKCRDAHERFGGVYDEFMTTAFGGPEEMGRWAVADLYPEDSNDDADGKRSIIQGEGGAGAGAGRTVVEALKRKGRGLVVVLGYSKEDELVEGEQGEGVASVLRQGGGETNGEEGLRIRYVECKGGHDEIVDQGVEIGRCVGVAVDMLLGEEG